MGINSSSETSLAFEDVRTPEAHINDSNGRTLETSREAQIQDLQQREMNIVRFDAMRALKKNSIR